MTMALGVLCYFFLVDFPDKNQFLTHAETKFVLKRIEDDRGDSVPDKITLEKVLHHLMDWKLWVYGCIISIFVRRFDNPNCLCQA
jgi:MFS transporter, ACS family, DAL5 transporter family protein